MVTKWLGITALKFLTLNGFSHSKIPILFCTKKQLPAAHNLRSPLDACVVIKDYRLLEQDNTL